MAIGVDSFLRRALPVLLAIALFSTTESDALTIGGPISANATVSGEITVSSCTVSTTVVTGLLDTSNATGGITGAVVDVKFSSSTFSTTVSSTSWQPVDSVKQTLQMKSSNNQIVISLTGNLSNEASGKPAYLTIYRDNTNLGDADFGLSVATTSETGIINYSSYTYINPVPLKIVDSPGDTIGHRYQVYIRSLTGGVAKFPAKGTGVLLLEETQK